MRSLLVAAFLAAALSSSAQSFIRAQIIFFRGSDGKSYNPPKQITIKSQSDIAKLTKFMPGLGYSKGGLKPGGWDGWGTIRLVRAKGPGIAVFFSPDAKVYSMVGKNGDFPASKGFKDYLLEIEKQAKQ